MTVDVRLRVNQVPVGLGEIKYSANAREALVAFGLGSCVGVAIWDSTSSLGALAHIILPRANASTRPDDNPFKYAERAIPAMINELLRQGADKDGLIVRIAGGAHMLKTAPVNEVFNIGTRNIEQVRHEIERAGLHIEAEDVLGFHGRTMSLFPLDGRVTVHSAGNTSEL